MKKIIFPLLLCIGLATNAQNDSRLQSILDSVRQASDYPGIIFTHVDSKGRINSVASGFANKEMGTKMTPAHRLHGGSSGKTIVSAVVMQLIQESKLSLDELVSTYFQDADWFSRVANSSTITIRHLLNHSSGIVRYEFKEAFLKELAEQPSKVWKPEELLEFVLDDEPAFEAGSGFTYADTNFILLGMIVEKITGSRFYKVADDRILKPLKLESFTPTNQKVVPDMAQGYYIEGSEYALGFKTPFLVNGMPQNNMQFEWTGGGYAYKNQDFAQWLKYLIEGEAFDMNQMAGEYFSFIDAPEISGEYGLGLMKYSFSGIGNFYGHSGFFPGYNTMGYYHLESKQVFTMQVNSTEMAHLRKFFSDYLHIVRKLLDQ